MNYVKGQFVVLPEVMHLDVLKINYADIFIYISIRSYSSEFNGCFPAYETIAERAGCCRSTVINAVNRLEKSGLISIKRSRKKDYSNRYFFTESYIFEKIPYAIFKQELTLQEKSILILVRQFLNRIGYRKTNLKLIEMSKALGISYKQLYKPFKSLIEKGYIEQVRDKRNQLWHRYTDKLMWDWILKEPIEEIEQEVFLLVG